MDTVYGVKIRIGNSYVRYAEERILIEEDNGDGQIVPAVYLPYVTSIEPFRFGTNLEGFPPIPTVRVALADPERRFINLFLNKDYEEADAEVILVHEGSVVSRFFGYVSSPDVKDGVLTFTVRGDEDQGSRKYLKVFEMNTFQWVDILTPRLVSIEPSFNINRDIPWSVVKVSEARTSIAYQKWRTASSLRSIERENPPGGLPPDSSISVIKLSTTTNLYRTYTAAIGCFIKVAEVQSPTYTYEIVIDDGVNPPVTSSYAVVGGETRGDILEGLASDLNTNGFTSTYFSELDRLYIQVDPSYIDILSSTIGEDSLTFFYDPDAVGTPSTLIPIEERIFIGEDDPYTPATTYQLAVLGDSQFYDRHELIAYTHISKGKYIRPDGGVEITDDENYYLSGIPSVANPNPLGASARDAVEAGLTDIEFRDKYGVSNKHKAYEWVSQQNAIDRVYVSANGLVPYSNEDPKLGVGFVSFGRTLTIDALNKSFYVFHRYKVSEILFNIYDDNVSDGGIYDVILVLELHVRDKQLSPDHEYFVNVIQGRFELPRNVGPDDKVMVAEWMGTVSSIDFHLNNLDNDTYTLLLNANIRTTLKDRYKGYRIDMIEDNYDLVQAVARTQNEISGNIERQEISKLNPRIFNNSNERFGICTGSEIIEDSGELHERLYFFNEFKDNIGADRFWIEEFETGVDPTDPDDIKENYGVELETGRESFYVNLLTYIPDWPTANQQTTVSLVEQGSIFFRNKRYRVVRDPVPESSQDLGKAFPIVYGYVEKAPMMHVISKRSVAGKGQTAGDDYYVLASHPIDVSSPTDISVWMKNDNENDLPVSIEDYSANVQFDIIRNPFPNLVEDHYKIDDSSAVLGYAIAYNSGDLVTPYHDLEVKTTRQGDEVFGIRLLGNLWDYRVGKMDRRYPIRNGVGSTELFGSYGGYVDNDGQLISHPCDIFSHFVRTYGQYPYSSQIINEESLRVVKSLTPKYKASVYMNEDMTSAEFINKLFGQFGLFTYLNSGQVHVVKIDLDKIQLDKPISENYNLLEGVEEDPGVYKDIFTDIKFNYRYSYMWENYQSKIHLNPSNNIYCSAAAKSKGGRKTFEMNADWVRDSGVAMEVAQRYARLLSSKYVTYKIKVRSVPGFFKPGDVVPFTCSRFFADESRVLIMNVQEERDYCELEVRRYY